jgi:hypothetical protein
LAHVRCGEFCKRGSDFRGDADGEEVRVGAKVRACAGVAWPCSNLKKQNRVAAPPLLADAALAVGAFPPNLKSFQRREIGYYVGAIFWIR